MLSPPLSRVCGTRGDPATSRRDSGFPSATATRSCTANCAVRTNTWGVNDAGGRAANLTLLPLTWYHMHMVLTDSGITDMGFDTSFIANNLINNTPGIVSGALGRFRRIGAVLTDTSSNILLYFQEGDNWAWLNMREHEVFNESATTTAKLRFAHVPPGLKIFGRFQVGISAAGQNRNIIVSDPDTLDDAPDNTFAGFNVNAISDDSDNTIDYVNVFSNVDGEIRVRSNATIGVDIAAIGYTDTRGRFD